MTDKAADPIGWLNQLDPETLKIELTRCCGAHRWVEQMMAKRPFASEAALYQAAHHVWIWLLEEDWREAFEHHPKIGDINSLKAKFANTQTWAEGEQSGVHGAADSVIQSLADKNALYESRFGYIFIVCATGKSAEEMLAILEQRLTHDSGVELQIAAVEQEKITRLRLEKLLA